jgi:hypothetical protein
MKDKQFEKELEKIEDDQWSIIDPRYLVADTTLTFHKYPTYVGTYELGKDSGTYFSLLKKPNWFYRTMVRLILGWIWKDN